VADGQQVALHQGIQAHVVGGRIGGGGCYVDDQGRPTVILSAGPRSESARHHLCQGDTFELGDEVWEVSEIRSPNSPYWATTLTHVR
jgi:hypothetical protein